MARISAVETPDGFVVAVTGSLGARDLRRLEHACGPAIERRRALRIVVEAGATIDAFARAYLDQLRQRGVDLQVR